jgi:hypothetical protein
LIGCAPKRELVRTETVEVQVPTLVRLEGRLTEVPPEPDLPPGPVVNDDLAELVEALRAWGKAMADQLREIEGLQPDPQP